MITNISQVIKSREDERNAWFLYVKPLSLHLWMALLLHSFLVILMLRIFWWHYVRGETNVSLVGQCLETIQNFIIISSSYLGNNFDQMPHNNQPAIKVKQVLVRYTLYLFILFFVSEINLEYISNNCNNKYNV